MESIELISDNALWEVACRAHETLQAESVVDDPFARHLVTARGETLFSTDRDPATSFMRMVGVATVDEMLTHAIARFHVHTVAALGAEFSTRPYRLDLPTDLRWIEVDAEPLLAYKALRLAHAVPRCQVRRLGVELSDPAGRETALHEIPTDVTRGLVLTERLPIATGFDAFKDLIERMPAVFSSWVVDTVLLRPIPYAGRIRNRGGEREVLAHQQAIAPARALEAFKHAGWSAKQFVPLREQAFRLDPVRAVAFQTSLSRADLQGVWLFQRARAGTHIDP